MLAAPRDRHWQFVVLGRQAGAEPEGRAKKNTPGGPGVFVGKAGDQLPAV